MIQILSNFDNFWKSGGVVKLKFNPYNCLMYVFCLMNCFGLQINCSLDSKSPIVILSNFLRNLNLLIISKGEE